jgi:hypothetical protein
MSAHQPQPPQQENPGGLSDADLAEADAESEVLDADIEQSPPGPARSSRETGTPTQLSEEDLAEAEAESDVTDADLEGP